MSQFKKKDCVCTSFTVLLYSNSQWIGWCPPTLGRTICFIQFTNSNANLLQETSSQTWRNNALSASWASLSPNKLMHKIKHHVILFPYIFCSIFFFFCILWNVYLPLFFHCWFVTCVSILVLNIESVTQSCLTLWGLMGCSLSGSSTHGILHIRTLEWVAIPFFRGSSQPRDRT